MTYTYASAFAGIGGMTMGLEPLGFKGVMAWECDPTEKRRQYAQEAHQLLHPHIPVRGDIRDTDIETIPNMDLFCFTPPCQAFSYSGRQAGAKFICLGCGEETQPDNLLHSRTATCSSCGDLAVPKDDRGVLTYDALHIVSKKKPSMLFMENVKGLLSHAKGATLEAIVETINEIGYLVDFVVLNSRYFDAPQNRERLYLVAVREDLYAQQDWALTGENTLVMRMKKRLHQRNVKSFRFNFPHQEHLCSSLGDLLESNPDVKYFYPKERVKHIVDKLPAHWQNCTCVGHNPFSKKYEFNGFVYADYTPTLIATDYKAPKCLLQLNQQDKELPYVYEKDNNAYTIRKLTPSECFQLQKVPMHHAKILLDNFSDSRCYRFAGNGLTISVIQAIGQQIHALLTQIKQDQTVQRG